MRDDTQRRNMMKSQILLTGVAALLVSVANANALEYRPFVGATMGLQSAHYNNSAKEAELNMEIDLPTDFFVFGIEGGIRSGAHSEIYNMGVTINATKSTYSKVQNKYEEIRYANADFLNLSATFDNYIRISGDKESRIDLVLGVGAGTIASHLDPVHIDSTTKWSFAPELKIGMDFELTNNITLSANARAFIPTRSHYEVEASYIFGGVLKYLF